MTASLVLVLALATTIATPDFSARVDTAIVELSIAQPDPQPTPPSDPPPPGRVWRLLGWGNYAVAGNVSAAQFYRESRTSSWEPTIENVAARLGVQAAGVETVNQASDLLRRRGATDQAWMMRIGYFAGALFVGISNYHNGWRRQ